MGHKPYIHREDEDSHGFREDTQEALDRTHGAPEQERDRADFEPQRIFHPLAPTELEQRRIRRAWRHIEAKDDAA